MRFDVYPSPQNRHQSGLPHTKAQGQGGTKHAEWAGRAKLQPVPAVTSVLAMKLLVPECSHVGLIANDELIVIVKFAPKACADIVQREERHITILMV